MRLKPLQSPLIEYGIICGMIIGLGVDRIFPTYVVVLPSIILLCLYPLVFKTFLAFTQKKISIEFLQVLSIIFLLLAGDIRSAGFVIVMFASIQLVAWRTEKRHAVIDQTQELLKKKPDMVFREIDGVVHTIHIERVRRDDVLIVKQGELIPADGIVVFGRTTVEESLVTGNANISEKMVGDEVLALTTNMSQPIKMRVMRVGKDSIVERRVRFTNEMKMSISQEKKLAYGVATYFLPIVLLIGVGLYAYTRDIRMVSALFIITSIESLIIAIPRTVDRALWNAIRLGCIIKGGDVLRTLSKAKTLILEKTRTLTYGERIIKDVHVEEGISRNDFWQAVAIGEKYSEHSIGKILFRESLKHVSVIPNAQKYQVYKSAGVLARYGKDEIVIGNENILKEYKIVFPRGFKKKLDETYGDVSCDIVYVAINGFFVGYVSLIEVVHEGLQKAVEKLEKMGCDNVVLVTSEHERSAQHTASQLGVDEYRSEMTEKEKISLIETYITRGVVAMVGDGYFDQRAFDRADVRIAIGKQGSALASETANMILTHDDFSQLPETIDLARRSRRAIQGDALLWLGTNCIGFLLVVWGMSPVYAGVYAFMSYFVTSPDAVRIFNLFKRSMPAT